MVRRVVFQTATSGPVVYAPVTHDLSTLTRNTDGTWTRTYRDGRVAQFTSTGAETSISDRVGRTTYYCFCSIHGVSGHPSGSYFASYIQERCVSDQVRRHSRSLRRLVKSS